ncbi:MAG: hypothetical protein K0Q66_2277 [Chitinophagaceae bacterium]|nr:hypothetical protein [Chitinophagaceae bacterium]
MDRVGALIHKLKEQYDQNVDKKSMLVTVQLILAEFEEAQARNVSREKVSVILPKVHRIVQEVFSGEPEPIVIPVTPEAARVEAPAPPPPVSPGPPSPAQPEAEPYTIKPPTHTQTPKAPPQKKEEQSGWLFDPVAEVPTLTHQKEVYELNDVHIDGDSLNDKLKEEKTELGATLKEPSVRDLRKAIGINDRYRFINELFRGDEDMYERSIKTINSFASLAEAQSWMQRELKVKIGWVDSNHTVRDFDQVVKRRFS